MSGHVRQHADGWRIFLVAWLLYAAHFTTNVVREHYPAFSLAEHGTLRVDAYQGLHPDIFVHRDGHSYINNQVFVSVLAALPLIVADPVLDTLERRRLEEIARQGPPPVEYRTDKPLRQQFFRQVRERGLDLRFGAATVVTSAGFMAPLTAAFVALFYGVLRRRGADAGEARVLALLLAFGTPLFYRASTLNHNMFVMFGMFAAFVLVWPAPRTAGPPSASRRVWAGLCAGATIATDYIGVVTLPLVFGYFLSTRVPAAGWRTALRETLPMAAGALPPIAFLLGTQWWMFGHPLYPAQYWMPATQNEYTSAGSRGFSWPSPDLLVANLTHPGYGLLLWMPIALLALLPAPRDRERLFPARERRFLWASAAALLVFCSMNQYARLQWNSGFRYLLPLVPLLMLAVADRWRQMTAPSRAAIAVVAVANAWVLTVFRETSIWASWRLLLIEGPALPWLRVVRMTSPTDQAWLSAWWLPAAILAATLGAAWFIWTRGTRRESNALAMAER